MCIQSAAPALLGTERDISQHGPGTAKRHANRDGGADLDVSSAGEGLLSQIEKGGGGPRRRTSDYGRSCCADRG